jgi:hypothetical protein
MVRVTVEKTVRCSPDEFLALVMDAERYAQIDDKLGHIDWVRRDGDVTRFKFRSRLPGMPGPMPKIVSQMRLTPGSRVDVEYAPVRENWLTRRLSKFSASFVCQPTSGGTLVTRDIEFRFIPVLSWLVEPVLRRTLPPDVEREVEGAKRLAEEGAGAG